MDGVLVIDKPEGITSHDVVARARRALRTRRVGHTGTLDPFATGVVVVLVGRATRLAQFLDRDVKEYEATVRFGFETDTGDRTGEPRAARGDERRLVSAEEIEHVLPEFRGAIWQTPPMYSAKKIAGKKLYELARAGVEVEREPVRINVYEIELLDKEQPPTAEARLRVACSAGTYVRVLAEDLGRRLGAPAHLAELRRTRAGKFDLSQAVTLEELEEITIGGGLVRILKSMNEAVAHLPETRLSDEESDRVKNGVKLRKELAKVPDRSFLRLTAGDGTLLAVGFYEASEKTVRPKLVLV